MAAKLTPAKLSMLKFRDLCRLHTHDALKRIVKLMKQDDDIKVSLAASIHILDRGFGKPVQTNELTGKDGDSLFAGLSDQQIKDEVRRRLTDPAVLASLGIDADAIKFPDTTKFN